MKRNLALLGFLLLLACKKKPFDYRNKYIGVYDCITHTKSDSIPQTNIKGYDTIYHTTIEVTYGSKKGYIRLLGKGRSELTEYELDKSGLIYENGYGISYIHHFEKVDSKWQIHLKYSLKWGGTSETVGIKQKK